LTEDELEDLQLEADDLLEQGNIEEAESYFEAELVFYNQSMEIYKRIGRTKGIIGTHQMIVNVYKNQQKYDEETSEFETPLQLSEEHSLFLGCEFKMGEEVGEEFRPTTLRFRF
jgi:tetratricopeptide (TPR) repeat protein